MAELRKKDELFESNDKELTTADLAKGGERSPEPERRMRPQSVLQSNSQAATRGSESAYGDESPTSAGEVPRPLAVASPADFDSPAAPVAAQPAPLFSESEVGDFRSRWSDIQSDFVDEPRRAVEDADHLVAALMKKLAEGFANERAGLEKQWDSGDDISTEDLRLALQRYRSFFDRLLKV